MKRPMKTATKGTPTTTGDQKPKTPIGEDGARGEGGRSMRAGLATSARRLYYSLGTLMPVAREANALAAKVVCGERFRANPITVGSSRADLDPNLHFCP
uniref:Uncharacterized protein n=1 Tax=Steinernema glaseri TaxID=37863 RepID=A0A1I7YSV3_9BILA